MRRLMVLVVAIAGLVVVAPAAAQTFFEEQLRPIEGTVHVESAGTVKLKVKEGKHVALKGSCTVVGQEAISNDAEHGLDETSSMVFSCESAPCGAASVEAAGLPWQSVLVAPSIDPALTLETSPALHIRCGASDYGVMSGTLKGTYGDGDGTGPDDDIDNTRKWKGQSGKLVAGANSVTFSLQEHFGTAGVDGISGIEPGNEGEGGEE